jgi:hypothetical protein
MRAIAMSAVVTVLTALMASIGVRAASSSPALTVRLYNTSGIPAPELMAARLAAESILRDTGLDVIFRHCGSRVSPDAAVDTCNERLKPSEVVVRVINAPGFSTTLKPEAYGVAYVVQETSRGWLATVFSDRIDQAATRVGVEPGVLLGRVMAHEIGHLLLGHGYHSTAGVMRAEWPDALLTHAGEQDWRFSTLEASRMQHLFPAF